jgi:hypothetical protein
LKHSSFLLSCDRDAVFPGCSVRIHSWRESVRGDHVTSGRPAFGPGGPVPSPVKKCPCAIFRVATVPDSTVTSLLWLLWFALLTSPQARQRHATASGRALKLHLSMTVTPRVASIAARTSLQRAPSAANANANAKEPRPRSPSPELNSAFPILPLRPFSPRLTSPSRGQPLAPFAPSHNGKLPSSPHRLLPTTQTPPNRIWGMLVRSHAKLPVEHERAF